MSYFSSQFAPRGIALALSVLAAGSFAQTPHHASDMPEPKPAAQVLRYESVFAHYKSYRDEKTSVWRESNETVDRIGGWRAYAREAQHPDATAPAKPNPHAGYGAKP